MTGMYLNPAYASHDQPRGPGDTVQSEGGVYASLQVLPDRSTAHPSQDYVVMHAPGSSNSDGDGFGFRTPAMAQDVSPMLAGAGGGLRPLPPPLPPTESPELPRKMTLLRRFLTASTLARLFGRHASVSSSGAFSNSHTQSNNNRMGSTADVTSSSEEGHTPNNLSHNKTRKTLWARLAAMKPPAGISCMQTSLFVLIGLALLLALIALGMAARPATSDEDGGDLSSQASTNTGVTAALIKVATQQRLMQLAMSWETDSSYAAIYPDAAPPDRVHTLANLKASPLSMNSELPLGVRIFKSSMPSNIRTVHWLSHRYVLLTDTSAGLRIWDVDTQQSVSYVGAYTSVRHFGGVVVAEDGSCFAISFSTWSALYVRLYEILYSSTLVPSIHSRLVDFLSYSYRSDRMNNAVALSNDATVLLVGTDNSRLCQWTRTAGSRSWSSQPSCRGTGGGDVASLAISSDNQYYLVGYHTETSYLDRRLELGAVAGGPAVWSLADNIIRSMNVYVVAFADNDRVALTCDGSSIYARSSETGRALWTKSYDCESLQVLADDQHVLIYEDRAHLRILAVADGRVVATIGVAEETLSISSVPFACSAVSMSPDGIIFVGGLNPARVFVPLAQQTWF